MLLKAGKAPKGRQRSIDSFFKAQPQKDIPKEEAPIVNSPDVTPQSSPLVTPPPSSPIITIEDFELDYSADSTSDVPSDTSSEFGEAVSTEPTRNEPKTEMIQTRHSELTRTLSRTILTPDWRSLQDDAVVGIKVTDFNMTDIHHQLEVIEHRIQMGKDEVHEHPAMAVSILQNEGQITKFSRKEASRRDNYEIIEERAMIPCFWKERRVYDKDEYKLTQEDSDTLRQTISLYNLEQDYISPCVTKKRSWPRRQNDHKYQSTPEISTSDHESSEEFASSPSVEEKASEATVAKSRASTSKEQPPKLRLKLSTKYFSTDDSDEETDFDVW